MKEIKVIVEKAEAPVALDAWAQAYVRALVALDGWERQLQVRHKRPA